uniref:Uncharacterized protein n=1 Tax=Grapevine-associated RNA virus 1 TaxID=2814384 RepID=A0A8F5RC12_9VIRU|nr:MAG: hypothetical protein [Grapevine-associated RNA virus 1]
MWITSSGNMYPLICDAMDQLVEGYHPSAAINGVYSFQDDAETMLVYLELENIQQLFINHIPDSNLMWRHQTFHFKPQNLEIFRMWKSRSPFFLIRFEWPEEHKQKLHETFSIEVIMPRINQLETNFTKNNMYNLTGDMRQVVITTQPQYSVNPTYRGRQSYFISNFRYLLLRLQEEYYNAVVDIELTNNFNVKPLATIRLDFRRELEDIIIYAQTHKSFPKYATLRYPPELLVVSNIYESGTEAYMTPLNEDEFESNVIIPNAGVVAAGVLGGLGQGIGTYYEMKQRKQMQDDMLAWKAREQQAGFGQQTLMQQSMFHQQRDLQGKAFVQDKYMQSRNFDHQDVFQRANFSQQNAYQDKQNQFTKELVEMNTDSDIRRARNAQQLAGYRTDATVSGLSMGSGRGGLGHPDAPVGASLPPRSASTQTNSPRVYTTTPSGFYTGPLSAQ